MDPDSLPLRDIHLPDPIGLWPLAYGWWLLIGGVVILILLGGLLWRRWQRRRPLREALMALESATTLHQQGKLDEALQLVSQTLRRMAMTLSAPTVAGLTGRAWLAWLDSRWPREGFQTDAGQVLVEAPYRSAGNVSAEQASEVIELARSWLQAQRVGKPHHG
jgi:hypothetical protein